MTNKSFAILILIFSVVVGCKSTKSLTSEGVVKDNTTSKQLIKENKKQEAKFKTLQAKVKIDYTEGTSTKGVTVTLRIEKDKTIWLSAPFATARVMITPDKVSYYNKLSNEFFEGDFSLLTELLGTELDFHNIQNLLLGEALFDLNEGTYTASTNETSYILAPKNQNALFEIFYLLNPGHFKVDSQQLSQPLKKRFLEIDYKTYQLVDNQIFPELIKLIAVEDNEEILIELELKSINLNEDIRFPFDIPSGYKEIVIK